MSIADHDIITRRYFFPRPQAPPSSAFVDVADARLACHNAGRDHDITVVHFHGNGEVVADYIPDFADALDELGANSFFAEYRGYGGSTGTPRLGAMLEDVGAIRDAIDVPDEQLVVFGRSIGSIYAIELAARRPNIAGLVIESGIADVLERILLRASAAELQTTRGEMEREFQTLFNHEKKLGQFAGPTLVLHAEHDHLVDSSHAVRNARWAGENAELVLFPRGDHNSIFHANRDDYLQRLGTFLRALTRSI